MTQQKKRMGGMSLSGFGRTEPPPSPVPDEGDRPAEAATPVPATEPAPVPDRVKDEPVVEGDRPSPAHSSTQKRKTPRKAEKQVTVNIKILKSQQQWLADTAQTVRDNNDTPVAPNERVYPQHLIGVAIAMLQNAGVDWSNVSNIEDLKRYLEIKG